MQWIKKWWWAGLLGLLAVAALGFVGWALVIPAPMPEAEAALVPDAVLDVQTSPWLVFRPKAEAPAAGLIFYPGGRVPAAAYAPPAREIAAAGFLVIIPPMPLNLAVFGIGQAGEVIAAFPEIERWAVGGHSLGGSMAAQYAFDHLDQVQGLVLWASYPASSTDLSRSGLKVVSISGTQDGLATPAKIEASGPLLPADTLFVPIAGGNHAQFGWYGPQDGDGVAGISRAEQQAQVVQATQQLLQALAGGVGP